MLCDKWVVLRETVGLDKSSPAGIHLGVDIFFVIKIFVVGQTAQTFLQMRGDTGSWSLIQAWLLGLIQTGEELFANLEEKTGLILVTK